MIRHISQQKASSRRGQSLILFLLVLIALIGILALTVDFGFVILARRHMQTGVNASAKAGMRAEGLLPKSARRRNARTALQLNFDDDFDLVSNTTTIGAGIDTSLIQGNGYQSTTIGPPGTSLTDDLANRSAFIYRPDDFELNTGNAIHGDIVTGGYTATASHEEDSSYARADLNPVGSRAMLVRMRRTHDPNGLDDIAGVSSCSGGLPLILARAGWIAAGDSSDPYSVRRDGVTVRATAIAEAVVARSVGVTDYSSLIGVAPIAMTPDQWQSLQTSAVFVPLDSSTGRINDGGSIDFIARRTDATMARFVTESIDDVELSWPDTEYVPAGTYREFFAPIYQSVTSTSTGVTEELICGFGSVQLFRSSSGSSNYIHTWPGNTAADNAAALPPVNWQSQLLNRLQANSTYVSLSPGDQATALAEIIDEVFNAGTLLAANQEGLRAPALVRTMR